MAILAAGKAAMRLIGVTKIKTTHSCKASISGFSRELRSWAESAQLTAYEIGGREEGQKKQRWQRWLRGEGLKSFESMNSDLLGLGYRLKIEKVEEIK